MPSAPLKVMLIEDHAVLRGILRDFIERLPRVGYCRALPPAEAAIDALDGTPPDLMLIDLSLPGMSGIDLIREVRKTRPELRCAILSGHRSRSYVQQALAAGADGYLLKGDPNELERGVEVILGGG